MEIVLKAVLQCAPLLKRFAFNARWQHRSAHSVLLLRLYLSVNAGFFPLEVMNFKSIFKIK